MRLQMKRLPPYARTAILHPDRHLLGFWIYTGADAWQEAKAVQAPAIVLPDGERPESFRWPVAGYTALIIRTSPIDSELQIGLARALLKAGARSVTATWNGPIVDFYAGVRNAA